MYNIVSHLARFSLHTDFPIDDRLKICGVENLLMYQYRCQKIFLKMKSLMNWNTVPKISFNILWKSQFYSHLYTILSNGFDCEILLKFNNNVRLSNVACQYIVYINYELAEF